MNNSTVPSGQTAGIDPAKIEEIRDALNKYVTDGVLPGIVVAAVRDGETALFDAFGSLDVETGEPMRTDSILRIYSMTKPMTGVALMTLYEEGLFSLDDPVAKYLPEFEDARVFVEQAENGDIITEPCKAEMTIRHLMTHTAGLTYGWRPEPVVEEMYREAGVNELDSTNAENVAKLKGIPLIYQPGTRWQYSVATDVLARLIEVLSGNDYRSFLLERVINPLGMVDTDFYVPEEKRHRFASCYNPVGGLPGSVLATAGETAPGGKMDRVDHPGHGSVYDSLPALHMGGGGLVSTASDYLRFATMLLDRGTYGGHQILKPETVDLMTTNHIDPSLVPIVLEGLPLPGSGFGLNLAVRVEESPYPGRVGEFYWTGVAGTYFFVSPRERLIGLVMTQFIPVYFYPLEIEFKKLLLEGLID